MCARGMRRWRIEGRDAVSIVVLALIIVLVRMLFTPAPVVLPSPSEFVPEQRNLESFPRSAPSRTTSALFYFDPNTIDSIGFLQLGFSSAQTHSLLKYRASGALFRTPEEFSRAYVVSERMYQRLAPYIRIKPILPPQADTNRFNQTPQTLQTTPPPRPLIELNGADTAQLKKLRGIGPYYAQKMVQYRDRLGGFVAAAQILEIEGIDEERFALFASQIEIDPHLVLKIDLKKADQSTLSRHPYIGPYAARWVVHYREQLGDSVCRPQALLRRNIIKPQQAEWLEYYVE